MSEVPLYWNSHNSTTASTSTRGYKGTSLTREHPLLGPLCRPMPKVLPGSSGGGWFLVGEVPLYAGCMGCFGHAPGNPWGFGRNASLEADHET